MQLMLSGDGALRVARGYGLQLMLSLPLMIPLSFLFVPEYMLMHRQHFECL